MEMVHEIRNPMVEIKPFTQLVPRRGDEPESRNRVADLGARDHACRKHHLPLSLLGDASLGVHGVSGRYTAAPAARAVLGPPAGPSGRSDSTR